MPQNKTLLNILAACQWYSFDEVMKLGGLLSGPLGRLHEQCALSYKCEVSDNYHLYRPICDEEGDISHQQIRFTASFSIIHSHDDTFDVSASAIMQSYRLVTNSWRGGGSDLRTRVYIGRSRRQPRVSRLTSSRRTTTEYEPIRRRDMPNNRIGEWWWPAAERRNFDSYDRSDHLYGQSCRRIRHDR